MSVSSSSLSSSSSMFNFDGIASGLNTTDIITKMVVVATLSFRLHD